MALNLEEISKKAKKIAHEYAHDNVDVPCTALEYNILFEQEYQRQYKAMVEE